MTIGIIIIFISGLISYNYWSFIGLLLAVGLASCLCGVFLGVLFGIPKINKNYKPFEEYATKRKYDTNTNLEEISDWLSKIIVGISLTQLKKIQIMFTDIADYVLLKNHCIFNCDFARPIIISIVIYFLIAGFLIGYFYTRLFLPKLLSAFDDIDHLSDVTNIFTEGFKKSTEEEKPESDIPISKETGKVIETDSTKTIDESQLTPQISVIKNKLNYLTEREIEFIKKILLTNNKFIIENLFDFKTFSVIDVLIRKGIIAITQGDSLRLGATLRIVDKEVLSFFKQQI